MTRPATIDEARARLRRLDGGIRLDEERIPPSWTAYVPSVGRGEGETWEAAWDAMVAESERRRTVVLGLEEVPALTITPDGHLTAADATVADVEQAIRRWRGERQAERERAEVARLEAAGLARWEAMTPHPKLPDVRHDAFGVAWKFEVSRWRQYRELSPVGWAPGTRVRVTGGRVAHVAGMGLQYCHRCGAYFTRDSSVAPDGMRLCGERP